MRRKTEARPEIVRDANLLAMVPPPSHPGPSVSKSCPLLAVRWKFAVVQRLHPVFLTQNLGLKCQHRFPDQWAKRFADNAQNHTHSTRRGSGSSDGAARDSPGDDLYRVDR